MTGKEEIEIRYTRPLDAGYLKEWISHPEVLSKTSISTEKEKEDAIACWMFFCRYQCSLTATINHIPCGIATLFLVPYKKVSHHSPFKICVDPKRWGQGIGSTLLKNIRHLAENYFHLDAIYIDVFGNNPLIPLLGKFGFHEFAKQENYVKNEGVYLSRTCLISEFKKGDKNEPST